MWPSGWFGRRVADSETAAAGLWPTVLAVTGPKHPSLALVSTPRGEAGVDH